MLDGTRVGQNLYQSFSSAQTDQDGLDAAANTPVQVALNSVRLPIPFRWGAESSCSLEFQLLFLDRSYQPSVLQNWYDEVSDFNSANINPFV